MIGRANYQIEDDRLKWLFIEVGGESGIILQLFSEEGREEYALEELWQGRATNEVVLPPKTQANMVPRLPPHLSDASNDSARVTSSGLGPLSRRMFSTFRSGNFHLPQPI